MGVAFASPLKLVTQPTWLYFENAFPEGKWGAWMSPAV